MCCSLSAGRIFALLRGMRSVRVRAGDLATHPALHMTAERKRHHIRLRALQLVERLRLCRMGSRGWTSLV